MSVLRIGSLFSGYEGLSAGVQAVMGGELAWVADVDPGAAAVLAHHFPDVPNLGDVTAVDWYRVERADLMVGGFPCQDISQAGVQAGLKHGTRSGLWHEFVKAIAAQRPRLVVIENVLGLLTARGDEPTPEHLAAETARDRFARLSWWPENELAAAVSKGDARRARQCRARIARLKKLRKLAEDQCRWHEQRLIRAIGTVLASLASLGYDAEWVVVTASAAGACHRRARIFILAFPAEGRAVRGEPVAVIEDGAWFEPGESLFGALPFTGRVPASGSMAGGRIYAAEPGPTAAGSGLLPTPRPQTKGGGSASEAELGGTRPSGSKRAVNLATATGHLLKTPTAQLAINGGSQHPDKRRAGGHGPTLAGRHGGKSLPETLLPTPRATDGTKGGPNQRGSSGDLMLPSAVMLLPTPTAADGDRTSLTMQRGNPSLLGALLPTPSVADGTGGHKTRSGDRKGEPLLGGIAMLLPTPTVTNRAGMSPSPATVRGTRGTDLGPAIGALLPTPSAGNFNDGEDPASWEARRQRNLAKGINGNGQGTPLAVAVQQQAGGAVWGPYAAAIRRWEAVTGRAAPPPTVPGKTGERLNPALPEWMQGLPEGWITDVPGLSRNAMLKLAGNGCVPQQVALALRLLLNRAGLAADQASAARGAA